MRQERGLGAVLPARKASKEEVHDELERLPAAARYQEKLLVGSQQDFYCSLSWVLFCCLKFSSYSEGMSYVHRGGCRSVSQIGRALNAEHAEPKKELGGLVQVTTGHLPCSVSVMDFFCGK